MAPSLPGGEAVAASAAHHVGKERNVVRALLRNAAAAAAGKLWPPSLHWDVWHWDREMP